MTTNVYGNVYEFGGVALTVSGATLKNDVSSVAPWHSVIDQRGHHYMANGIDNPLVLEGATNTVRNWGMEAPLSAPTLTLSSGALSNTSSNVYKWYYAYVNANAGTVSSPSPVSSGVTLSASKVRVKVSHAVPDSQVTHKRIFRNTDGQLITFYKVADISASVNSYVDNNADLTISVNEVMDTDNDPPSKTAPFVAFHNGRMHLFGSRVESQGTVTLASGSAVVAGDGTHFASSHVGQTFIVDGDTKTYTVSSVASAEGLTLTGAFGRNLSGSSYRIFPAATRSQWTWSKAGQPEYFPAGNATNVAENDGDTPTGLFQLRAQLFAAKRKHIYALLYEDDPATGGIYIRLVNRGLVNQRCAVVVEGTAYLLDERGFYAYDGQVVQQIDQAVCRLVNPSDEPAADRIDWSKREKFHGIYDEKRNRVVWFVCLIGDSEPRHAFVYDITSQRWVLEEFQQGITASCVMEDDAGRERVWLGDENGLVWAYGVSKCRDGAPSTGTLSGTLTGVSGAVLTDANASFYTTGQGLAGVPVYLQTKDRWGIIESNTSTALTLKTAVGQAAIGDSYLVGAVELQVRSRWFSMGDPAAKKRISALRVYFEKQSSEKKLAVRLFRDWSDTAFTHWDSHRQVKRDGLEIPSTARDDGIVYAYLNESRGYVEIPIGSDFANWVQFDFRYVDVGTKPKILGYEWMFEPQPGTKNYGG